MAPPISAGESSCRKWLPRTVTSRWFGHARQYSRWGPTRMEPGSPLTNSFGSALRVSQRAVPYRELNSEVIGDAAETALPQSGQQQARQIERVVRRAEDLNAVPRQERRIERRVLPDDRVQPDERFDLRRYR